MLSHSRWPWLALLLVLGACRPGGCHKPPPVDDLDLQPVGRSEVQRLELPPLELGPDAGREAARVDAGPADAGLPDAGLDAGPTPDAGADAGGAVGPDEEDETEDAGPPERACPKPPLGVRCSPDCWCSASQATTLAGLRRLVAVGGSRAWAVGGALVLLTPAGPVELSHGLSPTGVEAPFLLDPYHDPHQAGAAWSDRPGRVWLFSAGQMGVWRWDEGGFAESGGGAQVPNELLGAWGDGVSLWAVGAGGLILRGDGRTWSTMESGTSERLESIAGWGPGEAWAVGTNGTVLRYDGEAWHRVESGTAAWLNGVWQAGPDDVWVVGNDGLVLRGGKAGFHRVPSGTDQPLFGIWGRSARDLWVVGGAGTALRWDGRAFRPEQTETRLHLRAVLGVSGAVFAVGDTGAVLWRPE